MARRRWQPIEDLPLVGGRPCLDLVNTTGDRASGRPRERLGTFADWVVFLRRTRSIGARRGSELRDLARADPAGAERALAEVLALREALHRLLRAVLAGQAAEPADLALFNEHLRRASGRRRLAWSASGPAWVWDLPADGLGDTTTRLVADAAELLRSPDLARLAQCGACDWLYLDRTKNGSRRWCKKACGDRVKARRHYRRKKARARGEPG